ncbi:hypothetical protein AAFC00_004163 [Neodothiora populina]|uniref:Protein HRI1 n=1 Tax=Neodothiora populina TaxID=2781224 RepID=A0ABR3PIZ7_9PEZI
MGPPNEPSISIREWIKWMPDAESEPTSTLVLTSSRKQFVDVRILKPTQHGEPELPREGGPMARLEWGFAGHSHSTISDPSSTPPTVHSTWTHTIDSQHKDCSNVSDSGDMFACADGIHVLERGEMVNPATGKMTAYEEFWADYPAGYVRESGEEEQGKRWSVVVALEEADAGVKGLVVRVGEWCQGIIRVGDEICVERWRWSSTSASDPASGERGGGEEEIDNGWRRVARLGRLFLPCALTFMPAGLKEGSKVTYGDYKWEAQEVFSW